jgi:hypothetical protein
MPARRYRARGCQVDKTCGRVRTLDPTSPARTKQTFAVWPANGSFEVQAAQAFLRFICAQTSRGLLRRAM